MTDRMHVRVSEFRAEKSAGDGLTIEGYGAVFNQPTQIVDWLGEYVERIKPGAFKRTLAARGPARVKMQFDHGHDQLFGNLPIGTWEVMREDGHGLYVRGRMLDTWHTIPIRAAIEAGAVSGMSFRFRVTGEEWNDAGDERTITELNLFEVGPVTFPAYEGTEVGVRAQALDLWRRTLAPSEALHERDGTRDTMESKTAAVAGDGTVTDRSEADTAGGVTRRELRRMALHALRYTNEQASGDAA